MSPTRRHGVPRVALLLILPVVALLGSVYLPFVNSPGLVFGLPRLFLWTTVWVIAITPLLLLVECSGYAAEDDELDALDTHASTSTTEAVR